MGVTVHYVSPDGTSKPFQSACFAQLGKGSAYGKNPKFKQQYESFCESRELYYASGDIKGDAMSYYIRNPVTHIELRQEDAFDSAVYKLSWTAQANALVKFLIEESPFKQAYLSSHKEWQAGVLKVDIKNVTAEMTLHALQWFRLAGVSANTFNTLQQVDNSNPWRNCVLAYLLPSLWRGMVHVYRDRGDDTVIPEFMDKGMLTNPTELYNTNSIGISVFDLWGYPMNLLKMWADPELDRSNQVPSQLQALVNKHKKCKTIQGIFTRIPVDTIDNIKSFLEEFDQWVSA